MVLSKGIFLVKSKNNEDNLIYLEFLGRFFGQFTHFYLNQPVPTRICGGMFLSAIFKIFDLNKPVSIPGF